MDPLQVVYFGDAHTGPLDFFREFGQACEPNYNPADFYSKFFTLS